MTLHSNHHFPRHSHDQFGIGMVDFGGQRSWSGIGQIEAFAGDVITCNPGEMHDGAPLRGRARGWRIIYVDPSRMNKEVEGEVVGPMEIVRPVARDPVLARQFRRLFDRLTSVSADSLALEEALLSCIISLVRRHGRGRPSRDCPSVSVAKAIERLDAAAGEPVTLEELAALAGASRFQLLRSFSREVGITPHAYLIQRRVCAARRLLTAGCALADAANHAGFVDQSHMTRVFLRQVGVTPGRYQAAVAKSPSCNFVQD